MVIRPSARLIISSQRRQKWPVSPTSVARGGIEPAWPLARLRQLSGTSLGRVSRPCCRVVVASVTAVSPSASSNAGSPPKSEPMQPPRPTAVTARRAATAASSASPPESLFCSGRAASLVRVVESVERHLEIGHRRRQRGAQVNIAAADEVAMGAATLAAGATLGQCGGEAEVRSADRNARERAPWRRCLCWAPRRRPRSQPLLKQPLAPVRSPSLHHALGGQLPARSPVASTRARLQIASWCLRLPIAAKLRASSSSMRCCGIISVDFALAC